MEKYPIYDLSVFQSKEFADLVARMKIAQDSEAKQKLKISVTVKNEIGKVIHEQVSSELKKSRECQVLMMNQINSLQDQLQQMENTFLQNSANDESVLFTANCINAINGAVLDDNNGFNNESDLEELNNPIVHELNNPIAVSYTHLTLPTICSV